MRGRARVLLMAALLGAATTACGGPAARTAEPVAAGAPGDAPVEGRILVVGEPAGTAVAAGLVFPGSGWELPGTEGLTLLSAETLLEGVRAPLSEVGARAEVACDRGAFTFTLVAPPDGWDRALDLLLGALSRPTPSAAALDAARLRLRGALTLDQASPAWQARLAARQALYGDSLGGSPWEAPACGVPETLELFDLDHVRAGAYRFAPRMARMAVVGPVDPDATRARLEAWLPAEPAPPLPAPPRTRAGRRYLERNTVTAWSAHAFPFGSDADVEALRFLGALLEDAFGPHVSRPDVFAVRAELERHGAGGALIVHLITTPEAAATLAGPVEARVAGIAGAGVPEAVWARVARRYRGRRLLDRESPEARAAALALALAVGDPEPGPGDGWPDPAGLTPARVRAAAAALGAPARSVVGPRSARRAVLP